MGAADQGVVGADEPGMTGAESLVRSLLASDVDTCFAHPGTSQDPFRCRTGSQQWHAPDFVPVRGSCYGSCRWLCPDGGARVLRVRSVHLCEQCRMLVRPGATLHKLLPLHGLHKELQR
jgi:hypothetical protein